MRVWVDINDVADVAFFAPIVRRLEDGGHLVTVTARRFAGAAELLQHYGLGAVLTGPQLLAGAAARVAGAAGRTRQLAGAIAAGRYDVAAGTHSTDFVLIGWTLGLPQLSLLEPEGLEEAARTSLRLADEVAVPDVVSRAALTAFRPAPRRFVRYPGIREEYSLRDAVPDAGILERLGVPSADVAVLLAPELPKGAAPAEDEAPLAGAAQSLAGRAGVTVLLLSDDEQQRRRLLAHAPDLVVPRAPGDRISLLAAADVVLAGGSAALREAAALGTPAVRVAGRPSTAVEQALHADGRVRLAAGPADLAPATKRTAAGAVPRDPRLFVDELVELAGRRPRRSRGTGREPGEAGAAGLR